ncbi:MAG TPA: hypothetical protein VNU64_23200 [Burkholderiales bacterium]|nr:hypothetical protein [Burkholderiales bacterium]
MLHITNGDLAAGVIRRVAPGEVIPWRDVLHEGPVPAGLSLEELSTERAAFIADAGWGAHAGVLASFRDRDSRLKVAQDETVLWFEHDLYDQLQLIQVLDWFASHPVARLSLICEAEYLGPMQPARAARLFEQRKPVTARQLDVAEAAWLAFRSPHPAPLLEVIAQDTSPLPFLRAALVRHLQEFPWTTDGLSRTERAILGALRDAPQELGTIFQRTREEPAFMGDAVLRWHLSRLGMEGWIRQRNGAWQLGGRGHRRLERWLGGVRVQPSSPWRWDEAAQTLSPT